MLGACGKVQAGLGTASKRRLGDVEYVPYLHCTFTLLASRLHFPRTPMRASCLALRLLHISTPYSRTRRSCLHAATAILIWSVVLNCTHNLFRYRHWAAEHSGPYPSVLRRCLICVWRLSHADWGACSHAQNHCLCFSTRSICSAGQVMSLKHF